MKKFLITWIFLAAALSMASATFAAMSNTAIVCIRVTVVTGNISITRDGAKDICFGQVLVNSTTLTAAGTGFHNSGDTLANWAIAGVNTAGWTFLNDAPGTAIGAPNQVRLSALWHANIPAPLPAAYAADDTISGTSVPSSATNYAVAADPIDVKGYNIPPSMVPQRYLFFRMDTPLAGSTGLGMKQDFTVTVTASAAF